MSVKAAVIFVSMIAMLAGCTAPQENAGTVATTAETMLPETTAEETAPTTEASTTVASVQTTSSTENPDTTPLAVESSTTLAALCSRDSDCPVKVNSSAYCWTGQDSWNGDEKKVYIDQIEYVCSGAGTASALCVEKRTRIPVDRCIASNCFNGLCYPTHCFNQRLDESEEARDCGGDCPDCSLRLNITCSNDCDCMSRTAQVEGRYYRACETSETLAGELMPEGRCYQHDIYQNLVSYKCVKPGTEKSRCEQTVLQDMRTASCRDKNCTIDCTFRTMPYANLALLEDRPISFASIQ
ncbi:MAG: hypothetical protein PHG85_01810 [Candidatus Altiarchaeota archaeon]|nr:hypothetical protein [Candidatus Altiarchaeota archaeon]